MMNSPILSSTFLLTLLLAVGLVFFIRASTKDRTQVIQMVSNEPAETLVQQLQQYFTMRAYRVVEADSEQRQLTLEGFVRPSVFLAVFLSVLTGVGVLCLALVLSTLWPDRGALLLLLLIFSPLAGAFYWKRAGRSEQVVLKIEAIVPSSPTEGGSKVTVTAHRDELAELQRNLPLAIADL